MCHQAVSFAIAVHPGQVLQEVLNEQGITQVKLAAHLGSDVGRINEICRGRRGISAQMAVMLAKALGTSPNVWMNRQKNWELSQVDKRVVRRVRPLRKSA